MGKRRKRHGDAYRRLDINLLQKNGTLTPLILNCQHHVVLVDRFVHCRHLTLAEGVVKGAVDGLRGQAQPRGRVPVDDDVGRKAGALLVGADICQLRQPRDPGRHSRSPLVEQRQFRRLQRVLLLGIALPSAYADVLTVLQIKNCAPAMSWVCWRIPRNHLVREVMRPRASKSFS